MDGQSKNLTQEYIKQLQTIFPEAVTEVADKDGNNISLKVDMEKLSILLGEASIPEDDTDYKLKYGEKFSFEWAGKRRAIAEAQKRSTGTLRPCPEESEDWENTENLYIEGDNLEVLKLLQDSYLGAIKMIYIDPPYNTGKDFIYKDNYRDNLSNYLEQTNTTNAVNSEASGRYHTNWLNMMYPRLKLARNLLTDDGVIFISIDDNEVSNLKAICDEIFGEDCFVGQIVWKNKYGAGARTVSFIEVHEYILCYCKSNITNITSELDLESQKSYNKKDEKYKTRGGYMTQPLMTNSLGDRPNLMYTIEYNGHTIYPNKQWVWSKERLLDAISKNEVEFNMQKDGTFSVRSKSYLYDENGNIRRGKPLSFMNGPFNQEGTKDIRSLFEDKAVFDFTKPSALLEFLLSLEINDKSDSNFTVLDFFSGSSTTAHAILRLNSNDLGHRKFIMVQYPELTYDGRIEKYIDNEGKSKSRYIINPETGFPYVEKESEASKAKLYTICEIGKERIRRAGKKILEEQKNKKQGDLFTEPAKKLDIGFKVFKLDRSNVADWDLELNTTNEKDAKETLTLEFNKVLNILKEGRTELDLLYEVMLKLGLQLTTKVEEKEINGKNVFVVGHGVMVASFAKELTYSDITKMLEYKPDYVQPGEFKVVLSDESFASNNDKVNVMQLFKQKGITNFEII